MMDPALVVAIVASVLFIGGQALFRCRERLSRSKKGRRFVYAAIALISFLFTMYACTNTGFWFDEFAQICYSGMDNTLVDTMSIRDPTPPLFSVVANVWYHLAPYGERWLLLLPAAATAFAVYFVGVWGEHLADVYVGASASVLMGSSQMILEQCGFEFRSYGFYILFATLALYLHNRMLRVGRETAWRKIIPYGIVLLLLAYSHIFGAIMCLVLGIWDLFLYMLKRLPIRCAAAYLFAGGSFLPWFFYFLMGSAASVTATSSWMVRPSVWETVKLIAYLCSNHIVFCLLFAMGIFAILRMAYLSWQSKKGLSTADHERLTPLVVICGVIAIVYLYGTIRAEYASLWVKRYFVGLFPCVIIVCAVSIGQIMSLPGHDRYKKVRMLLCQILLLSIVVVCGYRTAAGITPLGIYHHREAAEWLYEQTDIHNKDTIVLSTLGPYTPGWDEYYLTKQGKRAAIQVGSLYDITPQALLEYRVVYVEYNFLEEQNEVRQFLNQHFVKTAELEDIRVTRYAVK